MFVRYFQFIIIEDYFQTILVPKITIVRHLHNLIGRTIGYCGRFPCSIVEIQYLSLYPGTNPLWLIRGIDIHHLRPAVGLIAY